MSQGKMTACSRRAQNEYGLASTGKKKGFSNRPYTLKMSVRKININLFDILIFKNNVVHSFYIKRESTFSMNLVGA